MCFRSVHDAEGTCSLHASSCLVRRALRPISRSPSDYVAQLHCSRRSSPSAPAPRRARSWRGCSGPIPTRRTHEGGCAARFTASIELADRELIVSNGDALSISSDVELWVDCHAFEAAATAGLAAEGGRSAESALTQLAEAAAAYHDDFLAGFGVPDSPPWEEWQFLERERLRQLYGRVLERLVGIYLEHEAWEPGLEIGHRWLALDPLNESAYRALIRLYSLGGQRAASAPAVSRVCPDTRQLGVPRTGDRAFVRGNPVRAPGFGVHSGHAERAPLRKLRILRYPPAAHLPPARTVGREPELRILRQCLERSLDAERQLVLVTGKAGIGKTSLVRAFLADLHDTSAWLSHGQCLELRGAGEPYLPILEALGRLAQGPEGQAVIAVLAQRAPTWLVQMPWLVNETLLQALQPRVIGATRERMLREMAEALTALSRERPLVLVIEDLHWADVSTVTSSRTSPTESTPPACSWSARCARKTRRSPSIRPSDREGTSRARTCDGAGPSAPRPGGGCRVPDRSAPSHRCTRRAGATGAAANGWQPALHGDAGGSLGQRRRPGRP